MCAFQPILHGVPECEPPARGPVGAVSALWRDAASAADGVPAAGAPGREVPVVGLPRRAGRGSAPGCRSRLGSRGLRSGSTGAPAGIRRAQRTAHRTCPPSRPSDPEKFIVTALRVLLEVLDRRRPIAQLDTLCVPSAVHTVGALVSADHTPSRRLGAAVLTKFRLFSVDTHTVELIALYQRGPRLLALAGRLHYTRAAGWRITALRLT